MRVLVLCSYKERFHNHMAPFVWEQSSALSSQGVSVDFFLVRGRGLKGYLKALPLLRKKIRDFAPDVVHAHYGLCGVLANMQRKVPVVTTYHGSDIKDRKVRVFSKIAMRLSAWNLFVSQRNIAMVKPRRKFSLLPCGIDFSDIQLLSRREAREWLNIPLSHHFVLFASSFTNAVKDPDLAQQAIALLPDVELRELRGYSRDEVNLLMCAADAFLMTSKTEGSPQVIKEAMACGCPIVSVDVGDVSERINGLEGCYLVKTRQPSDLAAALRSALAFEGRTKGRDRIMEMGLTNEQVANTLIDIYNNVI